jgi:ankyrin repeat protein
MDSSLPLRANLEWLKKLCKERLTELRASSPGAKLSDVQFEVAKEFGFSSWPKLKSYVEQLRHELGKLATADPAEPPVAPDDPLLHRLKSAITAGDAGTVIQLLEHRPVLARSRDAQGQSPLHLAARFNDPKLCAWLMAYGADPETTFGESGHTALSWAVTCNAMQCAKTLVRMGAKADLYCAAGADLIDLVRSYFDESGCLRPGASRNGSSRFASDGSRLPCPPALPGEQLADALAMACRNGQVATVQFLLTKRPDLSFRAFMGGTPLHWAWFGGSPVVIELLMQAGADPTSHDDVLKCTPRAFGIAVAANWGFDFIVAKLLATDPNLANAVDRHSSPLHEAARGGHMMVVELLLQHHADPNFHDSSGKSAHDIALSLGHSDIAELLRPDST